MRSLSYSYLRIYVPLLIDTTSRMYGWKTLNVNYEKIERFSEERLLMQIDVIRDEKSVLSKL